MYYKSYDICLIVMAYEITLTIPKYLAISYGKKA